MNYLDSEEKYRVCLRPYLRKNLEKFEDNDTMLRIRIRDSYITGVTNVLWKVYDQIEVLAFPIYVKLTKTFYHLLQRIFFPENSEKNMSEDKTNLIYNIESPKKHPKKPKYSSSITSLDDTGKMIKKVIFPSYFAYVRISKLKVKFSYFDGNFSIKVIFIQNLEEVDAKLHDFVINDKFLTVGELKNTLIKHAIVNGISQLPSFVKQKVLGGVPTSELELKSVSNSQTDENEESLKILFGIQNKK